MLRAIENNIVSLYFCLMVAGVIASCQSADDTPKPIQHINHNLNGLLFEKGSYWIYQDSISGNTDSTRIVEAREELARTGGGPGGGPVDYIQTYRMYFENLIDGHNRHVDAAHDALYNYGFNPPNDYNYFFIPADSVWDATVLFYRRKGLLSPFTVNNRRFSKVYVFELDSALFSNSGTFDRVYLNNQEGIVQYSRYRNNKMYGQFQLIRANLIRASLKY